MVRYSRALFLRRENARRATSRERLFPALHWRATFAQWLFLAGSVFAVGLIFLYLWQSWQMVSLSAQLSRSQAEIATMEAQKDRLELEVSEAFSITYISQYARERLGMLEAEVQVLTLPPIPR